MRALGEGSNIAAALVCKSTRTSSARSIPTTRTKGYDPGETSKLPIVSCFGTSALAAKAGAARLPASRSFVNGRFHPYHCVQLFTRQSQVYT